MIVQQLNPKKSIDCFTQRENPQSKPIFFPTFSNSLYGCRFVLVTPGTLYPKLLVSGVCWTKLNKTGGIKNGNRKHRKPNTNGNMG